MGVNLGDMYLTNLKKIRLMICSVIVAYILAIKGIIQQKIKNRELFNTKVETDYQMFQFLEMDCKY